MTAASSKKKNNLVLQIFSIVILLGFIFLLWQYISDLQKELQIKKQNLYYTQDSLRISRTTIGVISEKYIQIIKERDDVVQAYLDQGKELVVLQKVNLHLTSQLVSDTTKVDTLGGVLTAVFNNTQADSGLIINYKDSVVFYKENTTWAARNFPEISVFMFYNMIIYRDETGLLSGSLETFSPSLRVSLLDTKIVDNYVPPLSSSASPSVFAVTAGGSYYYANVGLFLRLGRWAVNPSYNFLLSHVENNISSWYTRFDIKFIYFIW